MLGVVVGGPKGGDPGHGTQDPAPAFAFEKECAPVEVVHARVEFAGGPLGVEVRKSVADAVSP